VTHACNSSYLGGKDQKNHSSKPVSLNSSQDRILKIPNKSKVDGVAQVVEHLPSKYMTLSSNFSTAKKKISIYGLGCASALEHLPSMHKALDLILGSKTKQSSKCDHSFDAWVQLFI
jgi:hypothetical protein